MCGNFAEATPDTGVTEAARRRCELTVHGSTKLNRSHAVTGATAVILPCRARTDRDEQDGVAQFVTVEDSMSVVHRTSGHLPPPAVDLPSEVEVVTRLAAAVMPDVGLDWDGFRRDNDRTRDVIERVIPGFEDFHARVRDTRGFVLPNPPRDTPPSATPSRRPPPPPHHP